MRNFFCLIYIPAGLRTYELANTDPFVCVYTITIENSSSIWPRIVMCHFFGGPKVFFLQN